MSSEKIMPRLSDWLKEKKRQIHLIGVSGSGMIGLARILLESGHQVSGSDLQSGAQIQDLVSKGLIFKGEHQAEHVMGSELVVYSTAIRESNPERLAALKAGIPQVRRAECLAGLVEARDLLIVAGTHGKTTSTVMLTAVLKEDGRDPGFYIGADAPAFGASSGAGQGEFFAAEADESDGSILLYHPQGTLILNVEEDHLDYYRDLSHILEVFTQVVEQTQGSVVVCADDLHARSLVQVKSGVVTYGLNHAATFEAYDILLEERSSTFRVRREGKNLGDLTLSIPGLHNVSNATGVIALAISQGVSFDSCVRAMAGIRGASRRFDVRYQDDTYLIVDDYAHHPTEIRATLAAAKRTGRKRVVAVFQPHRYSRTLHLQQQFATAFGDADRLYLTDIYGAGETPVAGVDGESFYRAVKEIAGEKVHYSTTQAELKKDLALELGEGDCLLTMGAGDIHRVAETIAEDLRHLEELRLLVGRDSILRPYEPMRKHTSLRVGGPAQFWFEPVSEMALARMLQACDPRGLSITMIGRGTNLLVKDSGIKGVCVHLGQPAFSDISINGTQIRAGAGARLKDVVYQAKKAGLGGLEFMEGIPGNLGGALRMNAGAMQSWVMEVTDSVRYMDLKGAIRESRVSDMEVQYRNVPLLENHIALSAVLRGIPRKEAEISEVLKGYSKKRWSSQPAAPSAGCTFKNSGPIPSGKLIEELGLKDMTSGAARISPVHANFIVNEGGATAQDVLGLVHLIRSKALAERGITLELEVKILGD
jgi:UDP-N-acetylmuramate--alanine ligase